MLASNIRNCVAVLLSAIRVSYLRFMGVTVGKHCFISKDAHVDVRRGKTTIGNYVRITGGVYILSHTARRSPHEGQETRIEDSVTIFVNAVVLPGVTVGKNSVVGAGAVVTKDVPPNVTVMGNPARVVWPKGNRPKD